MTLKVKVDVALSPEERERIRQLAAAALGGEVEVAEQVEVLIYLRRPTQ